MLEGNRQQRWKDALAAADRLRDKFGESSVSLAAGMRGNFRERTHENPAGLPGKRKTEEVEKMTGIASTAVASGYALSRHRCAAVAQDDHPNKTKAGYPGR